MAGISTTMAAEFKLGRCKLLRSNADYLHQVIQIYDENSENEQSGELLWTDGEKLWLSTVKFTRNSEEFSAKERFLVGEFESLVIGISCSALIKHSTGYFIAVVLKEKVVVLWRKIGEVNVTVVKDYFVNCLPRGCEWHPHAPMLSVLSKTSAVLLCFSEEHDCNIISIKTSHRNLQTCVWSEDGGSLAVAVEEGLNIFSWRDLNKPNHFTCTQWNSLQVAGKVNCIVPWKTSSFIVATELPLDKLCSYTERDGDLFEMENFRDSDESRGIDSSGTSVASSKDFDFTLIAKCANQGETSLLHLKLKKPQSGTSETFAQIIALCLEDVKPREICRTSIKGLISPDLLLYQPATKTVVVGSHCSGKLNFYTLNTSDTTETTGFVENRKFLELDSFSKPKGICTLPGHANDFLVLLGKPKEESNMVAFPPSAVYELYDVSLRCFSTVLSEGSRQLEDKCAQEKSSSHCLNLEEKITSNGSIDCSVPVPNKNCSPMLRLPGGSIFNGHSELAQDTRTPLISELELSEERGLPTNFKAPLEETPNNWFREIQDVKATVTTFVSQMNKRLSTLERDITKFNSDQKVYHSQNLYPLQENAEFVCVVWTDELTGAVEQENFLLDKGRLKLRTIKEAFNASLVRICIGDVPCIVSFGEGDFIPIRFVSGSTVQMSGHSKHHSASS